MPTCNTGPCWTATTINGTFQAQCAGSFNNIWLVGGTNSITGNAVIQYSTDGIAWTSVDLGYFGGVGVKSFAVGNGIVIGLVSFTRHVISSDGISWSAQEHYFGDVPLTFGGGYFVLRGGVTNNSLVYSSSGSTGSWGFTDSSFSAGSYMDRALTYGNGLYVGVGNAGFCYTNSVSTPLTLVPYTTYTAGLLAYGNGVFIAIETGLGAGNTVFRSTDGTNWTTIPNALPVAGGQVYYNSLIFAQDRFLACKTDSNSLIYSTDGLNWTLTSGDHLFDSGLNNGQRFMATDGSGLYMAVSAGSTAAQVGVCPCSTPITYGDYWARLSNILTYNISISKWTNSSNDPYYEQVVLLCNMSKEKYPSPPPPVVTRDMVLYVDAIAGLAPIIGNTTLVGNAPIVDNSYFEFNGAASIDIQNPNLYDVNWSNGKTVMVAAWMGSDFNTPGYRALLGAPGAAGLTDRIVNLYVLAEINGSDLGYRMHFSAGGSGTLSGRLGIIRNSWNMFAITQTPNGDLKYYLNGSLVPGVINQPFTGFGPGNQYLGRADNYWLGRIGYWMVYNTALTASEIQQNFLATVDRFPVISTDMIDESQYNNTSKLYYTGSEECQSYLVYSGGPFDDGNCWKCAWGESGSFTNRTVYYDSTPEFAMPGDFTIEAWIYNDRYSLGESQICLSGSVGVVPQYGSPNWFVSTNSRGFVFSSLDLEDAVSPTEYLTVEGTTTSAQWHHVAVVRNGNTVSMYIDGQVPTGGNSTKTIVPGGIIPAYKITATGMLSQYSLPNTWMQTGDFLGPFRITVGVARYTGPFTPPTTYFPTN